MEAWRIIIFSLCISAILKFLFNLILSPSKTKAKLPPGPPTIPIIGSILGIQEKSFLVIEPTLRRLFAKYGPLVTLHYGPNPIIFVANHSLAHRALVENGAIFADRPPLVITRRVMNNSHCNISSAAYGPTWRLLRRNLISEILHPSCVKSYSTARKQILCILIDRLTTQSQSVEPVPVMDHLQYAMFYLLLFMCFGDEFEEKRIKEIQAVQRQILSRINRFHALDLWPRWGKILFYNRWKELMELCENQKNVLLPLIKARTKAKQEIQYKKEGAEDKKETTLLCYVDTLMDLELPLEKRKLEEGEKVSLCSEFLTAGVDTTTTVWQWIMANLVKYPHVQEKLFDEIKGVVGDGEVVKEDDLQKLPYLKAVVLEGLRRHPPGHLLVPHAVTEDAVLDGYAIPKNASVNFMVADMGWDPEVWDDPMAFKPERFLSIGDNEGGEIFDVTGSKEIKMMPFGAGRRICPGYGLAMLNLEYFVANLIWHFEWKAVDGEEVDLSEKEDFAVVMKNPLKARLSPRLK